MLGIGHFEIASLDKSHDVCLDILAMICHTSPFKNFFEMGLQKGDVLIWKDDPSISVTILSERKVCYQGEETSISALSAKLKGYKVKHIQPTPHWLFNDRLLSEVYDETYPFEE